MWGKPCEQQERIVLLRQAVYSAMDGKPPLERNIRLTLRVHVGPRNSKTTGDMDNFISGICDSLMAAAANFPESVWWAQTELANIHPSRTLAIKDDSQVVFIMAEKIVGDTNCPWYELTIDGE